MDSYDVICVIWINVMFIIVVVGCVGHFWGCNDPSRPGWPDRDRIRLSFESGMPWIRRWPVQKDMPERAEGGNFTVNAAGVVVPMEDVEDELTKQLRQQRNSQDVEQGGGAKAPELKAKNAPPPKKSVADGTGKPGLKKDAPKLTLKERRAQEKTPERKRTGNEEGSHL